jgi:predicted O-methyltransferase YrrM
MLMNNTGPMNDIFSLLERTPGRHKELSVILSVDDEPWGPTARLLDLAIAAASCARNLKLGLLDERRAEEPRWYRVWPGEHYRLLAALVKVMGARNVIEIGTFTGMGALAIAAALPIAGHVATFDVIPWSTLRQTWLLDSDFSSGRITQYVADITAPGAMAQYQELFAEADFIFIDGPKDVVTERKFLNVIGSVHLPRNPIVLFDDIRVLNMIEIWRRLERPKLDLTSFGHWSGTGLVDWNAPSPSL